MDNSYYDQVIAYFVDTPCPNTPKFNENNEYIAEPVNTNNELNNKDNILDNLCCCETNRNESMIKY